MANKQMVFLGTKCQHCGKLHIAGQSQLGLMVVCSSCRREFVCLDETGELPFVKSRDINESPVTFEKSISRAFFCYGMAVPSSMHDVVKSCLSKTLSIGDAVHVLVSFKGIDYPVMLKWFINQRGTVCLHLVWTKGSGIHESLAEAYKEEYNYYMVQKGAGAKPWKVRVSLSSREDVFVLDDLRFPKTVNIERKRNVRISSDKRGLSLDDILS